MFLFLGRAGRSSALKGSAYGRLLDSCERGRTPQTYPGSPLIAMELLGDAGGRFVFCDLDGASLANIAEDARALGVPSDRVRLVQGDGVSTLDGELAGVEDLPEEDAAGAYLGLGSTHRALPRLRT